MKSIQGFVSIQQFVSNTPKVVSPIGELSLQSQTYTKETGHYLSEAVPGYKFTSFSSTDVDTGEEIEVPPNISDLIIDLARLTVAYAKSHSLPYDVQEFRTAVASVYPYVVFDLNFGALVYGHNIELPEYISFNTNSGGGAEVRFWLADAAFRHQYTNYSITVVPPLTPLDNFFLNYAEVESLLAEVDVSSIVDRMQEAKGGDPDTIIKVPQFEFVNRYNPIVKRKTPWGVLIYGKEGNYIDSILDAIAEYLRNNSSHSDAEWETVFPDIFKRTEFIIVPRWDRIATTNLTDQSSLYSQVHNTQNLALFPEQFLDFYGANHVRENTYAITFPFRTLQATITNGLKNAEGKGDWLTMFPDYIPVPTAGSSDFGRMRLATQEWSRFAQELLMNAETVTPGSFLPSSFRRVTRSNKLFIAASHKNVNYLVAAKWNQAFN